MKMSVKLLYNEYLNNCIYQPLAYSSFYHLFKNKMMKYSELLIYKKQEKVKWRTQKDRYNLRRKKEIEEKINKMRWVLNFLEKQL